MHINVFLNGWLNCLTFVWNTHFLDWSYLCNQKYWGFEEIETYLKTEIENSFSLIQLENKYAFEILCFIANLNNDCISLKLIEKLLFEQKGKNHKENKEKLSESLEYLVENSYINHYVINKKQF